MPHTRRWRKRHRAHRSPLRAALRGGGARGASTHDHRARCRGRLRLLESHPDNSATSEGLCLKGQSYIERVYSSDRLLYPLLRTSGGGFERSSWEQALEVMAERLGSIVQARLSETPRPTTRVHI